MKPAGMRRKFDSSQMQYHFLQIKLLLFEMYTSALALEQFYEMTGSLTALSEFGEF
jgi:hypothetical protein